MRVIGEAKLWRASGDARARHLLLPSVEIARGRRQVGLIRRCLDLASRIGARELALHYALCLWTALPGHADANRALAEAATCHPARHVAEAGRRMSAWRARVSDLCVIAEADRHADWPQILALGPNGSHAAVSLADLMKAGHLRVTGVDGAGAWMLKDARVTRASRSVAIGWHGVAAHAPGSPALVPGLSVRDPSAAVRWPSTPTGDAYDRLGFVATRFSFSNYWHWLVEGLLHAVRLEETGLLRSLDRFVVCLVDKAPPFISESLEAVGISASNVSMTTAPFDVLARELVAPVRRLGFTGMLDETTPAGVEEVMARNARRRPDIQSLRRRLGIANRSRRPTRRLLVSRRDAATRRVVNEDELAAVLTRSGFEVITPGCLTFAEQVTAFSSAEIVVGPHGAALTNALFMPADSALVELHPTALERPWFRQLAAQVGVRHRSLHCEVDAQSPQDMVVNVDAAVDLCRDLVARG